MEALNKVEQKLATAMKGLPSLPASIKKSIVEYSWVAILVSLILCVLEVFQIFEGIRAVEALNSFAAAFGGGSDITGTKVQLYIMLAVWLAAIALQAMAIVPLKEKQYKGWQYTLYAAAILLVLTVVTLIMYGLTTGMPVFTVIADVAVIYALFQVRDSFLGHKATPADKKEA